MHEIFKAMGKVVPGLATQTGHRQHVDCRHISDLNQPIIQQVKCKKNNLHGDAIMAAEEKKIPSSHYLMILPVILKQMTTCSQVTISIKTNYR